MANEETGGFPTIRRVVLLHALAAPGADTNIFTAITPSGKASAWRIGICLSTGSKVDVRVTDGSTAYSQTLNNDVALTANCFYTFTLPVAATSSAGGATALTYSIRVKTNSVIQTLIIDEVIGPVI